MSAIDPKALRDRLKAIIGAIKGKAPASSGNIAAHIDGADVRIHLHGAQYMVSVRGPGYSDTGLVYGKDYDLGQKLHPGLTLSEIEKQRDVPFRLTIEGGVMSLIEEIERDPMRYAKAHTEKEEQKREAWKRDRAAKDELAREEMRQRHRRIAAGNAEIITEIIAHVERIRRLSAVSAQLTDRSGGTLRLPSANRTMFIPHDQGTILCGEQKIIDAKTVRPFFRVKCLGIYCTVTTDGTQATGTAQDLANLRDRLAAVSNPFTEAKRVGRCFFCFHELTDDVSRHYGYGPDCASGNFLPYDRDVLSKLEGGK